MPSQTYRRQLAAAHSDLAAAADSLARSAETAAERFPIAEIHAAAVLLEWCVSLELAATTAPEPLRRLTGGGTVG